MYASSFLIIRLLINSGSGTILTDSIVNFVTFGNMAYINISNDGNRLVGPLGLKKAEQELIKRRYKYSYNNQ